MLRKSLLGGVRVAPRVAVCKAVFQLYVALSTMQMSKNV